MGAGGGQNEGRGIEDREGRGIEDQGVREWDTTSDLEREICRLCGLSSLLAPGLLRRALADVGAATPPTPEDLLRALPKLEARMAAYLPRNEVRERSAWMRRILRGTP